MTTPLCSVVLPVRDASDTLAACLDSIAAQTLEHFEIVAIDDGSRDATPTLLERYAHKDNRLRVIRNPNPGLVGALNAGLAAARSALVARMDADDLMHPERLHEQVTMMHKQTNLAVLGTQVELIESNVTGNGLREYIRWQNTCTDPREIANQRFVESPLTHPSTMLRRDAVIAEGGYRDGPFPEDYELWLRLLARGYVLGKVPRVLMSWRDGPARLSRTDPRCHRDAFDALRARYLAQIDAVTRADTLVIWGAGRKTRRRVAHLQSEGIHVDAWIDIDPKKIGNIIEGARVHEPSAIGSMTTPFVLSYVANHGARDDIAAHLTSLGMVEGRDWLSVG